MTETQLSWIISTISIGELLGAIPAGMLSDKWGRKPFLLLTGPMYFLSWIVIFFSKSYVVFLIVRLVQGLAVSIVFTVLPVYLGEIASPSQRGRMAGIFSIGWFLGFFLEYCLGAFLLQTTFTLVTVAIPFIFTILFAFQPESPYYLVIKERYSEAASVLKYLRADSLQCHIGYELEEIKTSVARDLAVKCSWKDVVDTAADRRALLVVLVMGFTRLYSGVMPLLTYCTQLFYISDITVLSPNVLTIILGLAMFLGGLVNTSLVDSVGRRPLINFSCIGSFFCLIIVGIFFFVKQKTSIDVSSFGWIVPLGVIIYCIFSVVGLFPVSIVYTSELFTNKTRGKSSSISTIQLTVGYFVSIKLYQIIIDYYGYFAVFWFFSLMCLLGGVILYCIAPETKGKSLFEIRAEVSNTRKTEHVTSDEKDNYI